MAVIAWAASTAYSVGNIRRATTQQASGLVFKCTTAGTSASSQPAWPTDVDSTITDNTVVWTAISSVYADLASFEPDTIIELFELHPTLELHGTTGVTRWHAGVNEGVTGNIVWNGNTYTRLPVKADGFEFSSSGTLPRPTLTVANNFPVFAGSITALLIDVNQTTPGNDLGGAEVRRIRTLKKFLDGESGADPYATWPEEIWFIDRKSSENRDTVTFELTSKFDLANTFIPKRQLIANICQWEYRSSECSYTGANYFDADDNVAGSLAADRCGKRLDSCAKRFANFESTGVVVTGSNQLTLTDAPETVEVNNAIDGFGIPASTTVSSKAGNVITMSANATASTNVTVNGTLQNSNLTQIIVTSATGLGTSMTITGTAIQAGTTITGISGTTVTLNQVADVSALMSVTNSALATPKESGSNLIKIDEDEVVSVGQIVTGAGISPTATARVINVVLNSDSEAVEGEEKWVYLDYNVASETRSSYDFYTLGTQSAVSYTFKAPDTYKINKPADGALPFGSFPSSGSIK